MEILLKRLSQLALSIALIFLPSQIIGKENNLFDLRKNDWQFVVVERKEIKLWDCEKKVLSSLFGSKKYEYDSSDVLIVTPSLCFKKKQLLLAKNIIAQNSGKILMVDIDNGTENILFEGKAIRSPVLSPDNKQICFLSNRNQNEAYSLFVLDVSTNSINTIIKESIVYGEGYNLNISWSPDSKRVFYSSIDGHINIIDIYTRENKTITEGFDPICSPDGQMLLIKEKKYNPYIPVIYDLRTGKSKKIKLSEVLNAIWSPDGNYLISVRNISSIFRFNEWEREVVAVDTDTREKTILFTFEGFEYIDCKVLHEPVGRVEERNPTKQ